MKQVYVQDPYPKNYKMTTENLNTWRDQKFLWSNKWSKIYLKKDPNEEIHCVHQWEDST